MRLVQQQNDSVTDCAEFGFQLPNRVNMKADAISANSHIDIDAYSIFAFDPALLKCRCSLRVVED